MKCLPCIRQCQCSCSVCNFHKRRILFLQMEYSKRISPYKMLQLGSGFIWRKISLFFLFFLFNVKLRVFFFQLSR